MSRAECRAAVVMLREGPNPEAEHGTNVLRGERVEIVGTHEGWAEVVRDLDGYRGFMPADALGPIGPEPTHRVTASSTFAFAMPDLKSRVLAHLPFNARLAARAADGAWTETGDGFVYARHLAPVAARAHDFVAVAERFVGVPYLWGGNTPFGFDCSGLVQASLEACGVAAPRNSRAQAASLGEAIAIPPTLQGLTRGDLVFWTGHVGIMRDAVTLLHANAHHMAVASEPLAKTVARYAANGLPVTVVRRLAAQ